MSKIHLKLVLLAGLVLLTSYCNVFAEEPAADAVKAEQDAGQSEVMATVNGEAITAMQYKMAVDGQLRRLQMRGTPITQEVQRMVEQSAMDGIIGHKLLAGEAHRRGLEAPADEVDQEMERMLKSLGSESEIDTRLKSIGLTRDDLRQQIMETQNIRLLISALRNEVRVDEEQIKTYFESHKDRFMVPERVHASHILIKVDPNATEVEKQEALEKAQGLSQQAKEGEDFAELARQSSDGPSAPGGGDLGLFTRHAMVPAFGEAAFKLSPDEVSEPVLTRYGYHVIKVHERIPEQTQRLEEVENQVRETLEKERFQEQISSLIETLREKGDIQILVSSGDQKRGAGSGHKGDTH